MRGGGSKGKERAYPPPPGNVRIGIHDCAGPVMSNRSNLSAFCRANGRFVIGAAIRQGKARAALTSARFRRLRLRNIGGERECLSPPSLFIGFLFEPPHCVLRQQGDWRGICPVSGHFSDGRGFFPSIGGRLSARSSVVFFPSKLATRAILPTSPGPDTV